MSSGSATSVGHRRMRSYSEMKALMATAAIVVIATCGYFVYDNLQSKATVAESEKALDESVSYFRCLNTLRDTKGLLQKAGLWEGKTHEERLTELKSPLSTVKSSSFLAMIYETSWKKCGPIE